MCTFTGDRLNSNAAKGSCTDTAGYISNAEIDAIKSVQNVKVQSWHDGASNSDMMVYNGVSAHISGPNKTLQGRRC